jgi:hypothetical protein
MEQHQRVGEDEGECREVEGGEDCHDRLFLCVDGPVSYSGHIAGTVCTSLRTLGILKNFGFVK